MTKAEENEEIDELDLDDDSEPEEDEIINDEEEDWGKEVPYGKRTKSYKIIKGTD